MSRSAAEHVRDDRTSPWWAEHVARYRFASQPVPGRVLDVACGAGLGFDCFASGDLLVGGDLSRDALADARAACDRSRAVLCRLDVTRLPFRSRSFDTITCFETIEHVVDDQQLVGELARVVDDSGVVFVSTPNALVSSDAQGDPLNPFHVREYRADGFLNALSTEFHDVQLYGQVTTAAFGRNPFFVPEAGIANRVTTVVSKLAIRAPLQARRRLIPALFPSVDDWEFSRVTPRSHVLLAICRQPR